MEVLAYPFLLITAATLLFEVSLDRIIALGGEFLGIGVLRWMRRIVNPEASFVDLERDRMVIQVYQPLRPWHREIEYSNIESVERVAGHSIGPVPWRPFRAWGDHIDLRLGIPFGREFLGIGLGDSRLVCLLLDQPENFVADLSRRMEVVTPVSNRS
jgi:hypothetical protein